MLKVSAFSISLDGFGAGPGQDLQNPMGLGGMALHNWVFPTKTFRRLVLGQDAGTEGVDNGFSERSFDNLGAWILGRNMFTPSRGAWPDDNWQGWWGDEPPYHVPVFVLTHYPRKSLEMKGGTVFHFVTGGISEALDKARKAAGGKDIRLGGGVATVRQFLVAGYIDELHLAQSPVFLGQGENLFAGLDWAKLGYSIERISGENATHLVMKKT